MGQCRAVRWSGKRHTCPTCSRLKIPRTTQSRRPPYVAIRDLPWPEFSLVTYDLQSAVLDTLIVTVYRIALLAAF